AEPGAAVIRSPGYELQYLPSALPWPAATKTPWETSVSTIASRWLTPLSSWHSAMLRLATRTFREDAFLLSQSIPSSTSFRSHQGPFVQIRTSTRSAPTATPAQSIGEHLLGVSEEQSLGGRQFFLQL